MKKREQFQEYLRSRTPEQICAELAPHLTEARMQRIDEVLSARIHSIHLASETPSDIFNALAMVRTAESMGVGNMHIIGPEGKAKAGKKTTSGAARWVDLRYYQDMEDFLPVIRSKGLKLAGAAVQGDMYLEELPIDEPLCLIFGNEQMGLSDKMIAELDYCYRIPMYGMTESYNLSVSAALSLYSILSRKRQLMGTVGDLDEQALALEKAWYYYKNLPSRLTQGVLK